MSVEKLRPDEWANILIAKLAEAINGLPISTDEKLAVRAMMSDTLPRVWPGYAASYVGPRLPCGCPDRPDEDDYKPHLGQPCDWSHWHPNEHSDAPREDRFCWLCGAMETQTLEPDTNTGSGTGA
jgi:hypothetical protein